MKARKWKPENIRKFENKYFDVYTYTSSKTKANSIKQSLKKDGYLVRVVKSPNEKYKGKYVIYVWTPKHLSGKIPTYTLLEGKVLWKKK